jgi:hypothetical protein
MWIGSHLYSLRPDGMGGEMDEIGSGFCSLTALVLEINNELVRI